MPLRKEVITLLDLSFQTLENYLTAVGNVLLEKDQIPPPDSADFMATLKVLLFNGTAWYLHDRIAEHCLKASEDFYKHCSTQDSDELVTKGTIVVGLLASVAPQPKLKKFYLRRWSKPIQNTLISMLDKMTGLELLECTQHFDSTELSRLEEKLLASCPSFTNLNYFNMVYSCNDRILSAISQNCKSIRTVIVNGSRSISDRSVESLLSCEELKHVELNQTSVSQQGYFKLLTESKSKCLMNIGICGFLSNVLDLIEAYVTPYRTYQLEHLTYYDVDTEHLFLIVKYFPNLRELEMYHDLVVPDLFCLSRLRHLKRLKLSVCDYYTDRLGDVLSFRGSQITSLCLDVVSELRIGSIIDIGVCCPNLENLQFYQCEFFEDAEFPRTRLETRPFRKLTKFVCISNITLAYVEFILSYAHNLEVLELRPAQLMTDSFFTTVFSSNPLKQLKILSIDFINEVSAEMLKQIIAKCDKISSLANFGASTAMSKDELKSIQDFVAASNYDLDLK